MKNISIFQGVVEFVTPSGKSYQFNEKDNSVYELVNGDWIYLKPYHGKSKSPSAILRAVNN
jgi:hypothetical protein